MGTGGARRTKRRQRATARAEGRRERRLTSHHPFFSRKRDDEAGCLARTGQERARQQNKTYTGGKTHRRRWNWGSAFLRRGCEVGHARARPWRVAKERNCNRRDAASYQGRVYYVCTWVARSNTVYSPARHAAAAASRQQYRAIAFAPA